MTGSLTEPSGAGSLGTDPAGNGSETTDAPPSPSTGSAIGSETRWDRVRGAASGSSAPSKSGRAAFFGWRIAFAGALTQMLISGLIQHAYTNYSVLLREEFGWSTTLIGFGFAMNRLESGLLGPIQGWMLDRFGPRFVMRLGAVVMAIGMMLFSTIDNPLEFFLFYLVVAIGASLAGFITVVTAVVNWFERRRSLALAFAQAGFPLGGLVTLGVVYSMTEYGWRATAFWSGVIELVTVLALAQVMHRRPSDVGQEVDGGPTPLRNSGEDSGAAEVSSNAVEKERDFTLAEAVHTRAFWMLNFGHATALLVVGSTMAHLSIYLTEEQGFSLQQAATLGTSLLMIQLIGQMAGGWFGDRVSKRYMVTGAMGGHVIGMLLFTFATAPWMVWLFVPFHGIAWGIRGPLLQAMRADYFGSSSFGRIMGWSAMIMMLGTMSGPIIVGLLRDYTGTYTLGFTVVTIGASAAIGFFLLATKPSLPVSPLSDGVVA